MKGTREVLPPLLSLPLPLLLQVRLASGPPALWLLARG